uniref:C2H2-type domain-containing protein n=1 Tax=Gouania willdenowi TaxID=441366 RepID=A0A8C5DIQ5_GOUWI
MAESETECDTPGLDTLGSECVIAHSHVDLHYKAEMEIRTEEKQGGVRSQGENLRWSQKISYTTPTVCSATSVGKSLATWLIFTNTLRLTRTSTLTSVSTVGRALSWAKMLWMRHLKNHQEVHAQEKPYTCGQCGKDFAMTSNMKQHQNTHATVVLIDQPNQCAQYSKCSVATTEYPLGLETVQMQHVQKKLFKVTPAGSRRTPASIATRGFNHSSSFSRHHKTHLQNPVFSPPQPGKPLTYGSPLKQQVHQPGDQPYMCLHCDKGFNHSLSLSRHQRVHSEGKTYNFGHCGTRFKHFSSLNKHLRADGSSPIPAPKGFRNNAFPKPHILSVEKPYMGSQCGKGFNHSSSLSRHHRIHVDQSAHI